MNQRLERPKPVLLDVSRLVRRVGQGPLTGIDRVELAWLERLLTCSNSRFLLRSTRGYMLLDGVGADLLRTYAHDRGTIGPADKLSRVLGAGQHMRHRVEAGLRKLAIGRCLPARLAKLLDKKLSTPLEYYNFGHVNFSDRVVRALPQNSTVVAMIHDTIPLVHPEYVTPSSKVSFQGMLGRVARSADLVVVPSHVTSSELQACHSTIKPVVAPLGIRFSDPGKAKQNKPGPPYLVCLGTIEPRKNHRLLLDAWESMETPPILRIVGARGWHSQEFFDRLDGHPLRGSAIFEHNDLSDAGLLHLLQGARGLLLPSYAEGYGLPPLEALSLGVPVIVSDLPVFRETLGNAGIYLDPNDTYGWIETIRHLISGTLPLPPAPKIPNWDDHFALVDRALEP